MATALQKQLAAIAATSSNELDLKAQKSAHSRSLLFSQDIAASQSFDLLWQICLEGYQDLCALDPRFVRFGKTIFSPQSRTEDRALMTSHENKELDTILESFMGLVGSRLLLRPALKAVEWLVRRFRIHESNLQTTIFTFLPYHNTTIFTSLLSILPSQLPPAFKFLHAYVHKSSNPPVAIIVHTASTNPGFFSAMNQHVLFTGRNRFQHTALLTLWASVAGQTVNEKLSSSKSGRLNVQRDREGSFLADLFPVLNEAISMRKAPEIVLTSYMLTVILVSKADLGEHVLDAFLQAVVISWTAETFETGLACAAAIFERKQGNQLPVRAFRSVQRQSQLGEKLAALAYHQNVLPLAFGILRTAVKQAKHETELDVAALVAPLLEHESLDVDVKSQIMQFAIDAGAKSNQLSRADAVEPLQIHEANHTSADAMDVDSINETDGSETESEDHQPTEFVFERLPARPKGTSFLTFETTATFNAFGNIFQQVSSHPKDRSKFSALQIWNKDQDGDHDVVLWFSFLARTWCTAASPSTRAAALSMSCESLPMLATFETSELLPYVLTALCDPSKTVRRSACSLVLGLIDDSKSHDRTDVRKLTFYDVDPFELSTKTFQSFLGSSLRPELEECQSDAQHILSVVERVLSGTTDFQGSDRGQTRPLKSPQRVELVDLLSYHVLHTPSPTVKLRLLSLCNSTSRVGGQLRSTYFSTSVGKWSESGPLFRAICEEENVSLPDIDKAMCEVFQPGPLESVQKLLSFVSDTESEVHPSLRLAAFTRLRFIWDGMNQSAKANIAITLLDLVAVEQSKPKTALVANGANYCLRNVSFTAYTLVVLLHHACDSVESTIHGSAKKRRTNSGKTQHVPDDSATNEVKHMAKLGMVLELVDSSKTVADVPLFHALFHVLRVVQTVSQRTSNEVDFILLLTLSNLLSITRAFENASATPQLDSTIVRNELVVDFVRGTRSGQVRNNGILLLSALTKFMPDSVLQSVIPVFTLVGSSTARQVDDFSVHVVDQTIREIIPLLVAPLKDNKTEFVGAMSDILSSFSAAFLHVPPTRRLKMFTLLASSLGSSKSLCAIVSTLIDQHPANGGVTIFCAQLLQQFQTSDVLQSLIEYIELISSCVWKSESPYKPMLKKLESEEDQESTVHNLLASAPVLIRDGLTFARILADMQNLESAKSLRNMFGRLLVAENTVSLAAPILCQPRLRNAASKTLEQTLKLLPFRDFIQSIEPLLRTSSEEIARSVLKSFEGQLRTGIDLDRQSRMAALSFLPKLTTLLKSDKQSPLLLNVVVCIDLICEKFGKLDTAYILEAATVVSSPECATSKSTLLRALCLHCLGTMVEILEDDFIPLLKSASTSLCEGISLSLALEGFDSRLHTAAFSLATAITDQLGYMVSAVDLGNILHLLRDSASLALTAQHRESREQFICAAASKIDVHICVEAMKSSWQVAVRKGPAALKDLAHFLAMVVATKPKSAFSKRTQTLLDSFRTFLDVRHTINKEQLIGIYTEIQINDIEQSIIDALMGLVLKINDAAFRPFFSRLVQWPEELPKSGETGKILRWTALFNLLASLSDRLKSLVTTYFTDVLEPIAAILSNTATEASAPANRASAPKSQEYKTSLLMSALTALTSSLRHDVTDFYAAPRRFNSLHPALIASFPRHNPRPNNSITRTHFIPALVALAANISGNQPHLVALQTAILDNLLKYNVRRSVSEQMQTRGRLAGVMVMRAIGHEIGEEWLAELPRMLPVVSELLEDDDERIEKETGAWVQEMEGVLGENVGDMLT